MLESIQTIINEDISEQEREVYGYRMQLSGEYDSIANKYDFYSESSGPFDRDLERAFFCVQGFLKEKNARRLSEINKENLTLAKMFSEMFKSKKSVPEFTYVWNDCIISHVLNYNIFENITYNVLFIGLEKEKILQTSKIFLDNTDNHYKTYWAYSDVVTANADKGYGRLLKEYLDGVKT